MLIESFAALTVLLPQDASLSQQTAAKELRDYCGRMGIEAGTIELRTDESLGENAYAFETVDGRLVISGSKTRGVLNGAYGYLQDKCGVEWFSSWCEQVPKRTALVLPAARELHRPAFEVRCSFWQDIMMHPRLGARLRMNSNIWYPRDDAFGPDLHKIDSLFEFAHSTRKILPAEKHFKDHPDWYSEIGGKRISKGAQPCLTNEEVFQFVKARLLERIKADPETEFYGFGLGDYYNDCTCAKCKAVNDREGSSGGTYWHFVNRLAGVLKEHAPKAFIKTSIYQQTCTPPKTIRIADNVILDWAPIEAVRDEPLATAAHPRSTGCMEQLRGFQKIYNGKFIVWDYTTDFAEYCLPFANLPVLQPNLKLFREIGTHYMFEQGNHNGWHGDFDELKGWLLAQWMWNPDLDEKALYRRFLNGYYGQAAAPYVRQYIDLVNETIRKSPKRNAIGIWNLPSHRPEYFGDVFLVKAAELWDAAEASVRGDPVKSYNVRMGAIPVRYLQCLKYAKTVNLTSDPKALEKGRAYAKKFVALLDEAEKAGHPVDFGETDHKGLLKRIRSFAGGAPVIGDGNVARLGSTAFLTTCWGTVCRHEKSDEGYDGDLIHLFNNDYGWFPSATLDMVAFDPDTEYTLRIRAKVKATGKDGELFSAGVVDTSDGKEYNLHVYPKDLKNGGDWAWYDVVTWKPGVGHMSYLYAAAGWFDKKRQQLSAAHEGVWIDGFEIVRKDAKLPADIAVTKPDYVVYVPRQPKVFNRSKLDPHRRGDSYNDHFQVIWDAVRKRYYAFWTQASWEGAGDHHVCFSKSTDGGRSWTEPLVLAGNETRDCPRLEADWQQPMLSKTGRLYCLWNQRARYKYGADTFLSGFYSDDGGETWTQPCTVARPKAKLSCWDVPIYTPWINWQRPLRLGADGRYFVGCSANSGVSFWRFENIDEDPAVVDIRISSFMDGTNRLTVANMAERGTYKMDDGRSWLEEASVVKLPDGRLFALMRSSIGHPVWSQSRDGGETWSPGKILRDAEGKPYLHCCSPCPIYDWKGPEAGSGVYFALIHDKFDFTNTKTCFQVRGPLYLIAGAFDPQGEQPIRFKRKMFFAGRDDGSWNSFYTSYTVADGKGVLWYPDVKYYLLGRKIAKEWFE